MSCCVLTARTDAWCAPLSVMGTEGGALNYFGWSTSAGYFNMIAGGFLIVVAFLFLVFGWRTQRALDRAAEACSSEEQVCGARRSFVGEQVCI